MSRIALLVAILSVFVLSSGSTAGPSFDRDRSSRPFALPIPAGQTWYVCQGYGGEITHKGVAALDLSIDPRSVGPKGCMGASKYSSAGSEVSSPAAGTAYRWPGCCGHDFVCVNFDTGGSAAIGHLSNRVASGTRVGTAARIGTVAWPSAKNGDYAHIHIQVHPEPFCTEASDPVPFDVAHGFRFECTPDLPLSAAVNQYSGLAVDRCRSPVPGELEERVNGEGDRDGASQGFESASTRRARLAAMVVRSLRSAGRVTGLAGRALLTD
ncbi:MAG: hypothetical protein M3198_16780 [Actinomycetota bacterium]|nr:hypothetical protein [Actinomycetota bacterium]